MTVPESYPAGELQVRGDDYVRGGFLTIPVAVSRRAGLSAEAKLVLGWLYEAWMAEGTDLTYEEIARDTGLHHATIEKRLKELVADGVLTKGRNGYGFVTRGLLEPEEVHP